LGRLRLDDLEADLGVVEAFRAQGLLKPLDIGARAPAHPGDRGG
jgi:hypothetical protein